MLYMKVRKNVTLIIYYHKGFIFYCVLAILLIKKYDLQHLLFLVKNVKSYTGIWVQ